MIYSEALELVKNLNFDKNEIIYHENNFEVYIFRPSKLSPKFKNYDPHKNFQIWVNNGVKQFRPNHLRILIDLNLRVRCRPDLKEKLLLAFDNIFYGNDPFIELAKFEGMHFEHFLNSINITGVLSQFLIIEQEYGYTSNRESNYDPASLFLQGWIREFLDNPKEIDNMCMSVCNGQPPMAKYTNLENKKSKKYSNNLTSLWYL